MLGRKFALIQSLHGDKSLLDVGSGIGYFPHFMQQKGYEVVGIEVDEKARNYSKEKFGIVVESPESLLTNKIKKKFGFITLWHVLEHLYNPDNYMQHFSDSLAPNGYLIIAVPNHHSFDAVKFKSYWAA